MTAPWGPGRRSAQLPGETAALSAQAHRRELTLPVTLSAPSPAWVVGYPHAVTGLMTATVFIEFCRRRLLHDQPGPVFLIVDGHPADEWVWKNIRHDRIGKAGVTSAKDLRRNAENVLHRLQRLPAQIQAFFSDRPSSPAIATYDLLGLASPIAAMMS